jgi:hypothetical protein
MTFAVLGIFGQHAHLRVRARRERAVPETVIARMNDPRLCRCLCAEYGRSANATCDTGQLTDSFSAIGAEHSNRDAVTTVPLQAMVRDLLLIRPGEHLVMTVDRGVNVFPGS